MIQPAFKNCLILVIAINWRLLTTWILGSGGCLLLQFSSCFQVVLNSFYYLCILIDMLFIFNIQYFHFLVATQGLLREGEDHLFHRVDPPHENLPTPLSPADSYPPLEVLPWVTPPPYTTSTQQPQARRKCYPACKGGAGFCQGRCVFFGMGCVQGKCSRSPYFWFLM